MRHPKTEYIRVTTDWRQAPAVDLRKLPHDCDKAPGRFPQIVLVQDAEAQSCKIPRCTVAKAQFARDVEHARRDAGAAERRFQRGIQPRRSLEPEIESSGWNRPLPAELGQA